MTQYTYTAIPIAPGTNTPVRGTRDATDERHLREELRAQGLLAIHVRPNRITDALREALAGNRLRSSDRAWFYTTLAFMLDAAVPVEEAAATMESLAPNQRLRTALADLRTALRTGSNLSDATLDIEGLALPHHAAIIRAGERSGQLARVTNLVARSIETAAELKRTLISKLIYPAILAAAAIAVLWALGAFVIPRFAEQLTALGAELPWQTALTLRAADTLAWLIPAIAIAAIAAYIFRARLIPPSFSERAARTALELPILGPFLWHRHAAIITDTIATMIEGGSDALAGLEQAADVSQSPIITERLTAARSDIREGADFASAFAKHRVLPPMINAVVAVGLKSGELAPALRKAASLALERQETTAQRLLTLIEPAIILLMAGSVFWVVYSLVSGMLAMTNAAT